MFILALWECNVNPLTCPFHWLVQGLVDRMGPLYHVAILVTIDNHVDVLVDVNNLWLLICCCKCYCHCVNVKLETILEAGVVEG